MFQRCLPRKPQNCLETRKCFLCNTPAVNTALSAASNLSTFPISQLREGSSGFWNVPRDMSSLSRTSAARQGQAAVFRAAASPAGPRPLQVQPWAGVWGTFR